MKVDLSGIDGALIITIAIVIVLAILGKYIADTEAICLETGLVSMSDADLKEKIQREVFSVKPKKKVATLPDYIRQFADTKRENTRQIYNNTARKVESFDKNATLDVDEEWVERFRCRRQPRRFCPCRLPPARHASGGPLSLPPKKAAKETAKGDLFRGGPLWDPSPTAKGGPAAAVPPFGSPLRGRGPYGGRRTRDEGRRTGVTDYHVGLRPPDNDRYRYADT